MELEYIYTPRVVGQMREYTIRSLRDSPNHLVHQLTERTIRLTLFQGEKQRCFRSQGRQLYVPFLV